MCVIIVKKAGVEMPSLSILRAANYLNGDGMGFISDNSHMRTMNFDRFIKRLQTVKKEENCIIHFRLATHGSVRVRNCHPFKHGDIYFFHNGVLPISTHDDMTDSETAFKRWFVPVIENKGLFSQEATRVVESIRANSRFAFYQNGQIRLFGLFESIGGVLYSNTRFMRFVTNV